MSFVPSEVIFYSMKEEIFEIYDENGNLAGTAPRRRCHGDPSLIHRVVHVVVLHPDGEHILLQKRSPAKDIQPGKWDTAVGGHVNLAESREAAAKRELKEELGIDHAGDLEFWFDDQIRNEIESENIRVFRLIHPGPFEFQKEEITEVKFWSRAELADVRNHALFTPNLVKELAKIL